MNIIFMGTPDFAVPTLRSLLDHAYPVLAVFTQPDRPKGRGRTVVAPPVKLLAKEHGIPVFQPEKVRAKDALETLREFAPDAIVVAAYGQILPESILEIPRLGCVNVHASLLPKYRGAAPIHWAIIRGEAETGITTMFMDQGMDTGDMLLQRAIPIAPDDTAGTLHDKLSLLGGDLLVETVQRLKTGALTGTPQNHDVATYAPMLKKEDGRVNWQAPAQVIDRHVRGMTPWPGAYTFFQGKMLKLLHVAVEEFSEKLQNVSPGTVVQLDKNSGPLIVAGEQSIRLLTVQPQNKNPMSGSEFCRGYRLNVGDQLET
ncbi:methionyl-tRNA formyltransferase [candidate division KSB3 bacterium]|uniref:Methionyl-tRNA formyltransferase n=1 Tax=candidate division KSB3 bacterium TaxID=2044937 RepID=A0A9D5Q421_9BACT|nr:methionyl-tRNA formyltransferase [candidate division KSB3 bacterium]MBD3323100.1 methionyl-tRNA formyltransferase [candidate division KSB3 bacterium]